MSITRTNAIVMYILSCRKKNTQMIPRNKSEKYSYCYSPMQNKCLLYPVKQIKAMSLSNNVFVR